MSSPFAALSFDFLPSLPFYFQTRVTVPVGYQVSSFPSLYAPNLDATGAHYLYYAGLASPAFSWSSPRSFLTLLSFVFSEDMWKFTVLWSILVVGMIYFVAGTVACLVFVKKHPLLAASIPFVAAIYGVIIVFISSTIVGISLAAIYNVSVEREGVLGIATSRTEEPCSRRLRPLTISVCVF